MREEAKHYLDQLNFQADLDRPVHAAELCRASACRHRQGAASEMPHLHSRRADRGARRPRDRAAVRRDRADEAARHRDHLYLASARRDRHIWPTAARSCATASWSRTRSRGSFKIADLIEDMTGKMAQEHRERTACRPATPLLEEIDDRADRMTVREQEDDRPCGSARQRQRPDRSPAVRHWATSARRFASPVGASAASRSPADAIAADIGFVPGERALGLVMNLSVRDNILLPSVNRDNHPLWINRGAGDTVVA